MAVKNILADPRYLQFRERYFDNFYRYLVENCDVTPTWQQLAFARACEKPGARVAVASGHGCFGLGTEMLMFDGKTKRVEDIVPGDRLMGDDSTPRIVLELKRGQEELYEFELVDGTRYVFNRSHILCLVASQSHGRQKRGDKCEPTVDEYLSWSDRRRRTNIFFRAGCSFAERVKLVIPPYILGVWLGDGTGISPQITNPEPEILKEWTDYGFSCGYTVTYKTNMSSCPTVSLSNNHRKGGMKDKLRQIGVLDDKHIPHVYKTATREERLELLAGLLDTDGYMDPRAGSVFEIVQKNERLARDIVYLARSLGMHATIKRARKKCCNTGAEIDCFRVGITRNIDCIPLRVARKRPHYQRNKQRDCLNFGVRSVTPLGVGDYYGFTVTGNGRFLGADFTVLHNTGKSFLLAWLLDWNLRVFPFSNAILTATNIEQARSVVWKYLDGVVNSMERTYPWMRGAFIKETKRYYAKGFKDSWYVLPRTASKSCPENLAGQHNENLMIVVDEASGVDDSIHGVLRGALTHRRNRYIMTSQPTRPAGHFADAMRKLAKGTGEDGIYDTLTMNSEESPIVDRPFILEKLQEYGGHHSPEYQIKVLGHFPDNMEGFLIPRHWVEDCQYFDINHDDGWGWVLLADVAEGMHRDSSVATIAKISGPEDARKVEVVECTEFLDLDELQFARFVASKYHAYPNLSIVVDGDGAGRTVILNLEEQNIPVQAIHWGVPCHSQAAQRRYVNLRAYAHYQLREAIFQKRFKGPRNKRFVEQASRLPFKLDERGRYCMDTKERMRAKGIKSPDISDTCCFAFLANYLPAERARARSSKRSEMMELAKAWMNAE